MEENNYYKNLTEEEKNLLNQFLSVKDRTNNEIEKFIEILILLREKPEENPQVKKRSN